MYLFVDARCLLWVELIILMSVEAEVPNCVIKVGMMGGPIDARWYDIYAAANAVQAMCVIDGEAGASIIYSKRAHSS